MKRKLFNRDTEKTWPVQSTVKKETYIVKIKNSIWSCTCPSFKYGSSKFNYEDSKGNVIKICKHIEFVMQYYEVCGNSEQLNLVSL